MTVKAREDADAANDSVTLVHTAAGGEYAGAKSDLAVTVDDDETVSVVLSKSSLTVVEGDTAGQTYTVKLSHEPSVEVTVTVTGQDQTDLELSGLSGTDTLTFDATTWDDAQTVTVKAREDADAKNDSVTLVHTAAGGEYAGAKSDVAVTVDDDETVSVVLSKSSLTVVEGDTAGQTYTVKLSHEPSVEVTVTVTGQDQTDLELTGLGEGNTLTFTTSTWDDAQTVTVKAREDADAKNDSVTLVHTAAGGEYEGVAEELAVTVDDDETVSIVLSKTTLTVDEEDADRRDLYGEAVPRAVGRGDGDGDRPGPDRPYAERSERDGHPDLQHDHLGRCADGDGEGQRGRRRQERLRHPGPHGGGRRVRGSGRGAGRDGGRRRDPRRGHQPHGPHRPSRRQQLLHRGPGVPAVGGRYGNPVRP